MKSIAIISLICFCSFVLGQSPFSKICFPSEFTVDQAIFEPQQQDIYGVRIFFSVAEQKERLDFDVIVEHDQPLAERVSFLFDYPAGIWYEITYTNTSASCVQHANLTGTLTPRCLSKKAHHRGTILLGGVIEVDNWVETVDDKNGPTRADILIDYNIDIPIRAVFRNVKGFASEEYWNFKTKVHHDAFVVPSVCQSAEITQEPIVMEDVMKKTFKLSDRPGFHAKIN